MKIILIVRGMEKRSEEKVVHNVLCLDSDFLVTIGDRTRIKKLSREHTEKLAKFLIENENIAEKLLEFAGL